MNHDDYCGTQVIDEERVGAGVGAGYVYTKVPRGRSTLNEGTHEHRDVGYVDLKVKPLDAHNAGFCILLLPPPP